MVQPLLPSPFPVGEEKHFTLGHTSINLSHISVVVDFIRVHIQSW
jgi:hypothetical protein